MRPAGGSRSMKGGSRASRRCRSPPSRCQCGRSSRRVRSSASCPSVAKPRRCGHRWRARHTRTCPHQSCEHIRMSACISTGTRLRFCDIPRQMRHTGSPVYAKLWPPIDASPSVFAKLRLNVVSGFSRTVKFRSVYADNRDAPGRAAGSFCGERGSRIRRAADARARARRGGRPVYRRPSACAAGARRADTARSLRPAQSDEFHRFER